MSSSVCTFLNCKHQWTCPLAPLLLLHSVLVGNADRTLMAVNGYPRAFIPADALLCFVLVHSLSQGSRRDVLRNCLRAPWCASDSLMIRLDNSCAATAEYQACIQPPGFSLTLSAMCHMSQPEAITVIWVSSGSWFAIVKRQTCCYQPVRHSCLEKAFVALLVLGNGRCSVKCFWQFCVSSLMGRYIS